MKFVKSVYSCASISTRASENCLTGEWQKHQNNNNNSNKGPLLLGGLSTLQTSVAKTATYRCEQKLSQPITANKNYVVDQSDLEANKRQARENTWNRRVQEIRGWFCFYFSLVEIMARFF